MSGQPLLILADTYRQACDYAQEHALGREGQTWRYVRGPMDVRGRRNMEYVVLRIPGHRHSPRETMARIEALEILRMNGFVQRDDNDRERCEVPVHGGFCDDERAQGEETCAWHAKSSSFDSPLTGRWG